jgi:hypothetical protein
MDQAVAGDFSATGFKVNIKGRERKKEEKLKEVWKERK